MQNFIAKLKNITRKKTIKNMFWVLLERGMQMIISLVIGMISARYLGPSNYGILQYGTSFITLFLAFCKLGLDGIIIKEIIENKEKDSMILGTSMVLRFISSLISVLLISLLITIIKPNEKITIIVTILQSISLIFQSFDLFDYWFQARLQYKYVSICKVISYIVIAIYKTFLLITSKSVIWFALTNVIEYLLLAILLFIMYKKNKGQKLVFDKNTAKMLLKQSHHFIYSTLLSIIYTQMDKIMIGNILSEYEVGLYSVSITICGMWGNIPDAIISSVRPTILEAKKNNEEVYFKRLEQLYQIIFLVSIIFAFIITFFSKLIILILYGEAYIGAKTSLIIASWYTMFAYLPGVRNIWIISENKNKFVKYYIGIGCVTNFLLNIALINLIGMNGAAIATLITQFTVCTIAPLFFKETRESVFFMMKSILTIWRVFK